MKLEDFVQEKIKWLGHASFRIDGSKSTVYIDPWKLWNPLPADLICITHSHFDHLSEEDVALIRKKDTTIVGPPDCKTSFGDSFKPIAPGETVTVNDVTIEAVPSYNKNKDFHPKKNNWVGFIVTVDGVRIYHAGDTDLIPEMSAVKADVALLPIGGTYTMTVSEAIQAANSIKAGITVPMHYGDIVGEFKDRDTFKAGSRNAVIVLDPIKGA
ncbi:MAG: MBL fold metallo-hydrolase [Deltaproteobacteria bacterium]|nr:MBL fold metallo-hydrolase [Deltaproteobacteria bacterium]